MTGDQREHDAQMLRAVVGGVTHEFNNLLGVMLGEASLLREAGTNGDTNASADAILEATRRASDLVSQLAGYCGFRDTADQTDCDLADVVRGMAHLLELIVGSHGRIRFELLPSPAVVSGSLSLIRETLIDLANVAITAIGRVQLAIRTGSHSVAHEPGQAQMVRHGSVAAGRRSYIELIGDTLTITPELDRWLELVTESLDCFVTLETTAEGDCIRLSLPFYGRTIEGRGQANMAGMPVILVDHDPEVRRVSQALLTSAGFVVHSCPDGAAGVGALRQGVAAEAVVLDVNMPDMDGVSTLETMRSIRPGLPCLFISGLGQQHVREPDLGSTGRTGFLIKPFDRDQLVEAIGGLIERRRR